MKFPRALALASFLGVVATGAWSQSVLDIGALTAIDDAEVVTTDGTEVGEIEDVLVDAAGTPVALRVDDDDDVVFALSELTFENGNYVTTLSEAEIEDLPRFDD